MHILPLSDYDVFIGDCRPELKKFLDRHSYSQIIVTVDEHTREHCLPYLKDSLGNQKLTVIRIPAGELHKNLETCQLIWQEMLKAAADRKALAINLGGGVIGDMGGFCASAYKRGIDFIQIPTTLLSQVDASIGGKLGIDFMQVKNCIGLFADPRAVYVDPHFLHTLSDREIRSGFAEIVKHSLIADREQWQRLREITALSDINWLELIVPSLKIKQRIVKEDPFEKGLRKALNFGHTIGHAVEGFALDGPHPLLHGEAIAVGMLCEAWLSHRILGLSRRELDQIEQFILQLYPSFAFEEDVIPDLLALMLNDKKNEGKAINFSLLPAIGQVAVNQTCEVELIRESLLYYAERVAV
ncbi:MAG: 3-dehydroquinate synthase [Lewinellaceae bacterium]|nr:3-dehydroquinate synthase [Lewinellaceae bacterium]